MWWPGIPAAATPDAFPPDRPGDLAAGLAFEITCSPQPRAPAAVTSARPAAPAAAPGTRKPGDSIRLVPAEPFWLAFGASRTGPSFAGARTLSAAAHSLAGWSCWTIPGVGGCVAVGWHGAGSDAHWRFHVGRVRFSAGLGCGSAFGAEKWAAPGDGAPGAVDDEGESHFRDFSCRLDRSVGGASPGLGLDFCGHGVPPVIALNGWPGLAAERQPAEPAESDKEARGSPGGHDQQILAGEA